MIFYLLMQISKLFSVYFLDLYNEKIPTLLIFSFINEIYLAFIAFIAFIIYIICIPIEQSTQLWNIASIHLP